MVKKPSSTFTYDPGCLESWITFKTGRRKRRREKKKEEKKWWRVGTLLYYIGPPAGVLLTVDDVNWSC